MLATITATNNAIRPNQIFLVDVMIEFPSDYWGTPHVLSVRREFSVMTVWQR
jgi:hypothetical protein